MVIKVTDLNIEVADAQDSLTAILKAFSDEIDVSNLEEAMDKLVEVCKEVAQSYSNVA